MEKRYGIKYSLNRAVKLMVLNRLIDPKSKPSIDRYWQVEETFRCMKSSLDLGPIYHWTDRRIEGHIMLCFLSFYILRVIQRRLREGGIDTSIERVMEELDRIKAVEIKTEKETIYARTAIEGQNIKIFKALGIKIPSFILKESPVVE